MTQGELEKLGASPSIPFSDLEQRIMEDIVRRIKINGFSTASADWQISRLQQLGESEENIKKWVQEALKASDKEIERIFSDEVYKQYMGHERAYNMSSVKQIPFEDNEALQQLTEAVKKQTAGTFESITGSLGFVKQDATTGRVSPVEISAFYRNTLDAAMYDIQSGTFDYQTVLKRTINDMTKSGLRWIDYESGRHNRVDVAARRAVMTGFRQVQGKINEQVAEQLGTDTYEVTYHVGARPTHQVWQGRIWTMKQLISICGLGSVTGLHGANCYHDYNPFIPGISVRAYTDEQLEQMINEENTPKYYNGREYTTYEALQQQRKMETAMRATRQQINLMGKGEADEEQIILKKARYQGQMREYKEFSKKMGLPEQMDRVYQDGLSIDTRVKAVEKAGGNGILKETTNKWSKEARKSLMADEKVLSSRAKETAVIYDADGKFLFQKRGKESEVVFSRSESKKLEGCVVSHNHPSGSSLSAEDIVLLMKAKAVEVRAATESGVFYMRAPEVWPTAINTEQKIREERRLIENEVKKECQALYKAGKISKTERFHLLIDESNKKFAERYGLEYGKETYED